jgi:superfamily I DNA/RNA helicase
MTRNPRVIFEGPAGTGKTLLAIESARRAASDGKRTLLVCFNRQLGRWLRGETESLAGVAAGTLHSRMLSLAGFDRPPRTDPDFWTEELPRLALDRLLDAEGQDSFDLVIADEAQDLLDDRYLDIVDLSLAGGLSGGEWRLFGDFERQSIYGGTSSSLDAFRSGRGTGASLYSLRTNCRNTPRVAALVRLLGHLDPDYSGIRRPDDGVEPDLRFHAGPDEATPALVRALAELRADGYKGRDVAVLSARRSDSSAERLTGQPWCDRLRPLGDTSGGHTLYGTIHAFKGLEAPAVIVTDLDDVSGPQAEALFYIAITRPTERLVLLMPESARPSLGRALAGALAGKEGASA